MLSAVHLRFLRGTDVATKDGACSTFRLEGKNYMDRSQEILSHWHKVYENFSTSSLAFYDMVEQEIERWRIPDVEFSRVEWKESGLLSSRRIYLRVTRGPLNFDICAAPYGTGYFFSCWVTATSKRLLALVYFVVTAILAFFIPLGFWVLDGSGAGLLLGATVGWGSLIVLVLRVRTGRFGNEEAVTAMPLLGRLYTSILRPITYYEIDTAHMFQEAVRHAVFEVIETVTTAKGIRELSEFERQPTTFGSRRLTKGRRFA